MFKMYTRIFSDFFKIYLTFLKNENDPWSEN